MKMNRRKKMTLEKEEEELIGEEEGRGGIAKQLEKEDELDKGEGDGIGKRIGGRRLTSGG